MFDQQNADNASRFANEFLARYTAIGFGALSKREIDLLLIQLLQEHLPGFRSRTDFDAARELRTTKRKIRGLRDEISYREAHDEATLKKRLRHELTRAEVLPRDHGMVMIQLDDAVLRGYAEKIVRSEFGIVDSSFNSAIMQLSGEKFLLLAFTVLSEEERQQAVETVNNLQDVDIAAAADHKSTFSRFRDAFVEGAGNQAGKLCVSGAVALATGGTSIILEGVEPLREATRGIGGALRTAWEFFSDRGGGAGGAQ